MTQVNEGSKDLQKRIEGWVLEVYKIPQCLTEGLTLHFISQAIDISVIDEDWLALPDADKLNRLQRVLDALEENGKLTSSMTGVKSRIFNDDENPPKNLPKRVRTYRIVRKGF